VLRQMFEDYYKRGRGYTVEDVEKTVAEVAGRSFKDFFVRYVHGTAELDYNAALAHVGLKLEDNPATAGANEVARRFNRYRIVEIEGASEAQKSLRRAWLGGAAKAQGAK
jgi:predicted metalloprotease with PDZ domain